MGSESLSQDFPWYKTAPDQSEAPPVEAVPSAPPASSHFPNFPWYDPTASNPAASPQAQGDTAQAQGEVAQAAAEKKPKSAVDDALSTYGKALKDQFSYIPPVGGLQHAMGVNTPGAAFYGGVRQGLLGNIPERVSEWGRGKIHDLTGLGNTEEQQKAADQTYQQQLDKEHGWAGLAGNVAGIGTGAYLTSFAAPEAMANTPALRTAWQGILGAGQGAWTGFASGEDFSDRMKRAATYGLIGAGLGLAGGAIGEGVQKAMGEHVPAQAQKAIKEAGLSPYEPASNQQEAIAKALGRGEVQPIHPNYGETGNVGRLNTQIQGAVEGHSTEMLNAAIDMQKQAASHGAMVSPDAFTGLRDTIATDLLKNSGIDLAKNVDPLGKGARALNFFDALEQASQSAAKAGKKLSLVDIESAHQSINKLGGTDPVVRAVQRNFDKWLTGTVDAHMFQGDPQAIQELFQWRKMYSDYKRFIDSDSALGNIINKIVPGKDVANWFDNATKLGAGDKAEALAKSIKGLVGEHSPAWEALRNLTWGRIAAVPEGVELNGNSIAKGIQNLSDSAVGKILFKPEELADWNKIAIGLRNLPKNTASMQWVRNWYQAIGFGIGALEGAGEGTLEGWHEGLSPLDIGKRAAERAAEVWLATKFGPGLLRGAGTAARYGAAPFGTALIANTPVLNKMTHARGGAVARAVTLARNPRPSL